jgi:hypothetical protein
VTHPTPDGRRSLTPAMEDALADASQLAIGVVTSYGPHVTPELFTTLGGRLWCLTAASTLKAKLLASGGPVAVATTGGEGTLLLTGHAVVVDALAPGRNLAELPAALAAPAAVGRFVADNVAELTGAVLDLFVGRLGGPLPPRRVVIGVEPWSAVLVAADGTIGEAVGWGGDDVDDTPAPTGQVAAGGDGDPAGLDLLDEVPADRAAGHLGRRRPSCPGADGRLRAGRCRPPFARCGHARRVAGVRAARHAGADAPR